MNDTPGATFMQRPVRPLTRCTSAGVLYIRPPEVERQIQEIVALPETQLWARLDVADENKPQGLKEETLAYLLREAKAAGHTNLAEQVANVLLERIKKFVAGKVRTFVQLPEDAAECVQDCSTDLFIELSKPSATSDFAQVKFWRMLDKIIIRNTRKYTQRAQQQRNFVFLDEPDTQLEQLAAPSPRLGDKLRDMQQWLKQLAAPVRIALVLYHVYEWPIESHNPNVPTISKYLGKSEKTIRNWLKKAEQSLQEWRGANYERTYVG